MFNPFSGKKIRALMVAAGTALCGVGASTSANAQVGFAIQGCNPQRTVCVSIGTGVPQHYGYGQGYGYGRPYGYGHRQPRYVSPEQMYREMRRDQERAQREARREYCRSMRRQGYDMRYVPGC